MKYISTRGERKRKKFTDILLDGLAADGGLYLPEFYPVFTSQELNSWRKLNYAQLAAAIFIKFQVDINQRDLKKICEKSYDKKIFKFGRYKSRSGKITPILKLADNIFLQELSNGPTLTFKDMAMQFLGNVFEYILQKKKTKINILGATSGDTGSAAEYALRNKKNIKVFMLSPNGKMSPFQRAQMYSLQEENIFNIAVNGLFDDAQDVVKMVSMDKKFKNKYKIGAVNSINWARVLAQVVYYVYGYLQITKNNQEKINFVVPTGNFGNICAGHVARMCGLPIENLILATNENDVLDDFFKSGLYRPRKNTETFITSSPSMDISKASNFERFVYDLFSGDARKVKQLFIEVAKRGFFDISKTQEFKNISKFGFLTGSSKHADRMKTIKKVYDKYNIFIDTHTADGFKVAEKYLDNKTKTIILETAQALKFAEVVTRATGKKLPKIKSLKTLETQIQKVYISDPDPKIIKEFIKKKLGKNI
jgi:threonine synthase